GTEERLGTTVIGALLCPEWFLLDDEPPKLLLPATEDKAGRLVEQLIPSEAVPILRDYLGGKPAGSPVWPGAWFEKGAEMLHGDLDAAGVPHVVEGPEGLLYADFHSLRHSFIALLDKAGATLKEAMHLARHSDPKPTMAVYGKPHLHALGTRVEQ